MSSEPRPPLPMPASSPLLPPEGFASRLAELGVVVGEDVMGRLGSYLGSLLAMNEQMNLTGIKEPAEAWERHALDALTLVPLLGEFGAGARLVDVGSGGGVPGIPIAIARPDLQVTLVEATQKKAAFLSAVSTELGLANVSVRAERAEVLGQGPWRGSFDVATARAVARIELLLPLMSPLVKPGGVLLLIKGQRAEEELAAATKIVRKQRTTHERTVATPTGRIVVLRRGPDEATHKRRK
jgi:16S rRNA (guanine527-N7)-methyltransferase